MIFIFVDNIDTFIIVTFVSTSQLGSSPCYSSRIGFVCRIQLDNDFLEIRDSQITMLFEITKCLLVKYIDS